MKVRGHIAFLALLLNSGCSFIHPFWVEIKFELDRCPNLGFELPERADSTSVQNSLSHVFVVAEESKPYCHQFIKHKAYLVPPETSYFEITDEVPVGEIYSKLIRGKTCELSVAARQRCPHNTSKEDCEKAGFSFNREELSSTLRSISVALLVGSEAKALSIKEVEVIGFEDDFSKWCSNQELHK